MIDNPPAKGTGAVLSFIATLRVDDGERQDQNPSLATVDRKSFALWRDHRAPY